MFVVIFFKTICNKTIISFGFCDILIKVSVSLLSVSAFGSDDNTYLELTEILIIPDITETSSNNCL